MSRRRFHNAACKEAGKTRVAMVLPDPKNKTKDLFFVTDQAFSDPTDAKNYTCLLGLHHIGASLPLERKLPDPYREAWLSMQTAAPIVSTSRRFACADDQVRAGISVKI